MIALSSTGELVAALQRAHDVSLTAYTLPRGSVLDALTDAAKHGARVRVRLEGYIYKDDGNVGKANADALARLRNAGADARFVHRSANASDPMLHLKGAVVDDALFLDDRNWPDDGGDTIVRDDFQRDAQMVRDAVSGIEERATPFFSVRKRDALSSEARLINEAQRGDDVIVESESFGGANRVYTALDAAAKRGAHVSVLVADRELDGNANEKSAIDRLVHDGAQVAVCEADEKLAVVGEARGWLGSTNATAAFDHPDQLDWGMRTDDTAILAHLRDAFDSRWSASVPAMRG